MSAAKNEGTQLFTISTLTKPLDPPRATRAATRVASVDVEWTKNYRIKNGNRPFCLSIVWIDIPAGDQVVDVARLPYDFSSFYVESAEEVPDLVSTAGGVLRTALDSADLLTGHQLCADLGVLAAHSAPAPVTEAREAWHGRRTVPEAGPRIVDTRYDSGDLLTGTSRRLVDVCTELGLDVTQPELRGTSMTALHRQWLERGDTEARERVSTLNLRHSLSTALVAAAVAGLTSWSGTRPNVNSMIAHQAAGRWGWLQSETFKNLSEDQCPSGTARS
ncbi:hypothetical protein ACIPYS_17760 [Kitasatospora sp. NPDC089913]|uniref:hypothetical protein n=1 Tax=Kitasatospora sp. NPDC089913 TaxID=3364080 RepID=UPI003807FE51